jgi:hypothetical protein
MIGKKTVLVAHSLSNSGVQNSNRTRVPQYMKKHLLILSATVFAVIGLSIAAAAQGPCKNDPGSVRSVTKTQSGNLETVTFEVYDGKPDVLIENVKPPFEDYGGKHLRIPGKAWKEVTLRGIFWTCTIRENFRRATRTITGIKQTEQFEGQASYVIGYSSKRKYVGKSDTVTGKIRKIVIKFRR